MYRWTLTNLSDMTTEVLTKDPVGWDEGVYKIKRSEVYKGVFHEYTTTLKFHCDGGGKGFIDNVYMAESINGQIDVLVEYKCNESGEYETLFNGVLNLASYKTSSEYTWCNIETASILTKLYNREDIKVDVESTTSIGEETITAPSLFNIDMPGMNIILNNDYDVEDNISYQNYYLINTDGSPFNGTVTRYVKPAMTVEVSALGGITTPIERELPYKEGSVLYNGTVSPIYEYIADPALTPAPMQFRYDVLIYGDFVDSPGDLNIANTFEHCHNMKLILAIGDDWDSRIEQTLYDFDSTTGDNDFYTVSMGPPGTVLKIITFGQGGGSPISLFGFAGINDGQYVWVYFLHESEGYANFTSLNPFENSRSFNWNIGATDSYFKITVDTQFQQTQCDTIFVHEALNQVVDSIADSDNNFYSEFYGRTDSDKISYGSDGCGSSLVITNGLKIREFPNKKIYCSLKDLFTSLDAIHNIGLGYVNNKIRVEPISFFYDNTTKLLTLASVNDFMTEVWEKGFLNKIDIGYNQWETEIRGGLDEPNTKREYSTKIATVQNNYQKVSAYLASTYAIEFTRRKNVNFNSDLEDWRYDNNNFFICVTRTPSGYVDTWLPEKRVDGFSAASNMIAIDTALNLRITPARMLLAHVNVITAGLQHINGSISFVRGDGNTLLTTTKYNEGCQEDYSAQALSEDDSIVWNNTYAANISPIWLPEKYTFEYPLTYDQFKIIKANPYGYIEFYKFSDDVKAGYIMSMEYKMKTGMTKFELIKANV